MEGEEFDRLTDFFKLSPDEKAKNFSAVLEDTMAFFTRFKEVMTSGSDDDKLHMLKQAGELQKVMQEESLKMCEEAGISEEELSKIAGDMTNFTEEQWDLMQQTKSKIEAINEPEEKKGSKSPKTKWLKS